MAFNSFRENDALLLILPSGVRFYISLHVCNLHTIEQMQFDVDSAP